MSKCESCELYLSKITKLAYEREQARFDLQMEQYRNLDLAMEVAALERGTNIAKAIFFIGIAIAIVGVLSLFL